MSKKSTEWTEQPLEGTPSDAGNTQIDGSAVHTNPVAERQAALDAQIESARQAEAKSVPGAPVLTPKGDMLKIPQSLRDANPDKHFRFITTRDPNKNASRRAEGYQVLSESEGGVRLGDGLALAAIPKDKVRERERAQEAMNRARLAESKRDVERVAEAVARELRDRHGINIPVKRLLVDE